MKSALRYLLSLTVVLLSVSTLSLAASAGTLPATCTHAQVALTATPSSPLYSSSTTVHITISLHNHSRSLCSYTTGPFSPNFTLTNSTGHTVWASCWFGGGPAPCAYYLRLSTLSSGATYHDVLTWDQRTGHPNRVVPAGRYFFKVSLQSLSSVAASTLTLTRSSTLSVSSPDSGRHYTLTTNAYLIVHLPNSSLIWSPPVSSDPKVLRVVSLPATAKGTYIFRALAFGTAKLSASATPSCYPKCLLPSRLFSIAMTVRAH